MIPPGPSRQWLTQTLTLFDQQSWHCFQLVQQKRKLAAALPHVLIQKLFFFFSQPPSIQRGKEEYKLAATSDGKQKKGKKGKAEKDMDDLKKEVDLVSKQIKASL